MPSLAASSTSAGVRRVVEVDGDRYRRSPGDRERGQRDRLERAVVPHAVLADLKHDGQPRLLGARDDGLGVLDSDHVEGAEPDARLHSRRDDLRRSRRRH